MKSRSTSEGCLSFVWVQSCDLVKPVCLAGASLSYVKATVADIGYTGDQQKSMEDCYWERRRHHCGPKATLCIPREKWGKGLGSVEREYKATNIKGVVRLYCNEDPAIKMAREFQERAEEIRGRSIVKEAFGCLGQTLQCMRWWGGEVKRCCIWRCCLFNNP